MDGNAVKNGPADHINADILHENDLNRKLG